MRVVPLAAVLPVPVPVPVLVGAVTALAVCTGAVAALAVALAAAVPIKVVAHQSWLAGDQWAGSAAAAADWRAVLQHPLVCCFRTDCPADPLLFSWRQRPCPGRPPPAAAAPAVL